MEIYLPHRTFLCSSVLQVFLAREKWFTLNGRAMALNLKFNSIFACSNMILEKARVINYVSVLIKNIDLQSPA